MAAAHKLPISHLYAASLIRCWYMDVSNQSPFVHPPLAAMAAAGGVTGTAAVGGRTPGDGAIAAAIVGGRTVLPSTVDWFANDVFFASLDFSTSCQQSQTPVNRPLCGDCIAIYSIHPSVECRTHNIF